jgi:Response regulators consisting of a CheY-like receiver domain and a winged-helix DNA-binding domain
MPQPAASLGLIETSELEIKSILLLDDDPELSDTLKLHLESRNFVVTAVCDGAEGLREILATDFEVIICDMLMPTIPGDMFYLAVKKLKPALAERFLFITGHAGNAKVESFLESIDALVIHKPVLIDELITMISLVLRNSQPPEATLRRPGGGR